MEEIVSAYLRELDIPISRQYAEKLIASHPEYPSMLSIADALSRLGIDHQVFRLPLKDLDKVLFPFLLKIERRKGWKLRVIKGQDDLGATVPEKPADATAIVVRAEPTEEVDDPQNEVHRTEENFRKAAIGGLLTALAGIFLLLNMPAMTWMHGLLLLTAMGGAAIGYLLVAKDLGITYEPVQRFCHAGSNTDDCDQILNSGGAQILDHFSLSDAAASYFLFQLILLGLIIPLSTAGASYYVALSVIGALTLPVIIYSIYYQASKARTWCRLCLTVDGVLLGQLGLIGYMYAGGLVTAIGFSLSAFAVTGLLLVVVNSAVALVKNTIRKAHEATRAETIANRVKHDPEVFLSKLKRQNEVDDTLFDQELLIGNQETPLRILMVASLGCGICRKEFQKASMLVERYSDHLHLAIRLRESGRGTDEDTSASSYLIRYWQEKIHGKPEASAFLKEAFEDWFSLPNINAFIKKFPIQGIDFSENDTSDLAHSQYKWVRKAKLFKTPKFFVNGYELPQQYNVGDLNALIPEVPELIRQFDTKYKEAVYDGRQISSIRRLSEIKG